MTKLISRFEDLVWHSRNAEEALMLQPCLADNLSEEEIDHIRYRCIYIKYGLNPSMAKQIREKLITARAEKMEKALRENAPSKMLTYAIFSGDLHL